MQTHNYSKLSIFNGSYWLTLLSAKGRLNRTGFLAYSILLHIVVILLVLKLNSLSLSDLEPKRLLHLFTSQGLLAVEQLPVLRGILPVLCGIYLGFCLTIQRLHDLNHSGYRSVLLLIPILNLMLLLYLLFAEGCPRSNRFGHPATYPFFQGCMMLISVMLLALSPLLLQL